MKKVIKIKKISLSLKKMTEKEKDYVAVVLEDVNHNFKVFGEVLESVREKGEATFEEVGNIKGELVIVNHRLDKIEGRLDNIEKEIVLIKSEIKELRLSLSKKADVEKLNELENRIIKIERHLKLSIV